MSENKYELEDILSQLRNELKDEDLQKELVTYSKQMKKYDTQALLDEILGQGDAPESNSTEKPPAELSLSESESASTKPVASPDATKPESAEASAPLPDASEQHTLQEQEAYEKEQLRQIMQSSAHLKYLTLRKNREKFVKNFVVKPHFTTPIEIHRADQDSSEENPDEKPHLHLSQDTSEDQLHFSQELQTVEEEQKKANSSPIKPYIPGQTITADIPVVKEPPELSGERSFSSRYIREWNSRAEDRQEDDDLASEYTVPAQTDDVFHALKRLRQFLTIRISVLVVLLILSLGIFFTNSLLEENPLTFLDPLQSPLTFCLTHLGILAAILAVGFGIVREGVIDILRRDPGRNALYSLALLAMIIFNTVILISPESVNSPSVCLYVPVTVVIYLSVMIGKRLAVNRMLTNFKFVSAEFPKYATDILDNQELAEDLTKGVLTDYPNLAYNRKTPFLSHFFDESLSEDLTDKVSHYTTPIVGGISLIVATAAFMLGFDIYVCLTILTGILLVGAGAVSPLVINYPLYLCAKTLSKLGGAVLGYNAIDNFNDANAVIVDASQLFSPGNITLYGIKTFSNMAIDRAILDATSVLCETNSILSGVFLNIVNNRRDFLDPVDTIIYEDGMGISAWISNRRILIGSRELMINHNINVPSKDYEDKYIAQDKNLIYLSAAGELSAVFVFGLDGGEDIREMLIDLINNQMVAIIQTVDPVLTAEELGKVFDMEPECFRVIPSRLHKELDELCETKEFLSGAVSNNGTLPAYLYSLLIAKRLRRPINAGMMVNYVAIGVGILFFILFTFLDGLSQLNNAALCLYETIFFIICIVVQRITKP